MYVGSDCLAEENPVGSIFYLSDATFFFFFLPFPFPFPFCVLYALDTTLTAAYEAGEEDLFVMFPSSLRQSQARMKAIPIRSVLQMIFYSTATLWTRDMNLRVEEVGELSISAAERDFRRQLSSEARYDDECEYVRWQ